MAWETENQKKVYERRSESISITCQKLDKEGAVNDEQTKGKAAYRRGCLPSTSLVVAGSSWPALSIDGVLAVGSHKQHRGVNTRLYHTDSAGSCAAAVANRWTAAKFQEMIQVVLILTKRKLEVV